MGSGERQTLHQVQTCRECWRVYPKKAKLDEKRAKLINDQRKLASDYRLEADRKRCKGKECFAMCPTGTVPAHRGCVAGPAPNPNPPLNSSQDCTSGFRWDGRQCVQEASTATQYGVNCNEYYLRLMEQKKILQTLRSSAHLACAADSASQDCGDFTQQVTLAEFRYRQLESEYQRCLLYP